MSEYTGTWFDWDLIDWDMSGPWYVKYPWDGVIDTEVSLQNAFNRRNA